MILGIEFVLNKKDKLTIERAKSRVIEYYSEESFKPFFKDKTAIESTIFTDLWGSYKPLSSKYNIQQEKVNKGERMKLLHTHIMNMKSWLRGIYHHISSQHTQYYMDEYHFKFNRRLNLENCFDKLINKLVKRLSSATKWLQTN
jgi:transposase-like protein